MRRNLSYPKDNDDKVRETNKQLRAQIKRLRKENDELRQELDLIEKPIRPKKIQPTEAELHPEKFSNETVEEVRENFRKDFVAKFKPKGGKK